MIRPWYHLYQKNVVGTSYYQMWSIMDDFALTFEELFYYKNGVTRSADVICDHMFLLKTELTKTEILDKIESISITIGDIFIISENDFYIYEWFCEKTNKMFYLVGSYTTSYPIPLLSLQWNDVKFNIKFKNDKIKILGERQTNIYHSSKRHLLITNRIIFGKDNKYIAMSGMAYYLCDLIKNNHILYEHYYNNSINLLNLYKSKSNKKEYLMDTSDVENFKFDLIQTFLNKYGLKYTRKIPDNLTILKIEEGFVSPLSIVKYKCNKKGNEEYGSLNHIEYESNYSEIECKMCTLEEKEKSRRYLILRNCEEIDIMIKCIQNIEHLTISGSMHHTNGNVCVLTDNCCTHKCFIDLKNCNQFKKSLTSDKIKKLINCLNNKNITLDSQCNFTIDELNTHFENSPIYETILSAEYLNYKKNPSKYLYETSLIVNQL